MITMQISSELAELGFQPFQSQRCFEFAETQSLEALSPMRVVCERRGEYDVQGEAGVVRAKLGGRLHHELSADERPAVGDWVVVEPADPVSRIVWVCERSSVLRRTMVGGTSLGQVLAANVDVCFVVCALPAPGADEHARRRSVNVRRIERYLVLAGTCRIPAVVVLNKADLAEGSDVVDELRHALPDTEIELVSALAGHGCAGLTKHVGRGMTAVLLGSSGVGKSTLANRLLERDTQRTGDVRDEDARGRHTTTERELRVLPQGGMLIDTPGMRELALWADSDDARASTGFAEIDELAQRCRFRDCSHHDEPGCAVLGAVETAALSLERLESFRRLERELAFQRRRTDVRLRHEEHLRHKVMSRAIRADMRRKDRR